MWTRRAAPQLRRCVRRIRLPGKQENHMIRATGIALLLIFAACGDSGAPLEDDYSYIEDPHERWRAYRIADYRINQTYGCECLPPYSWTALVRADAIVGAVTEEDYPG